MCRVLIKLAVTILDEKKPCSSKVEPFFISPTHDYINVQICDFTEVMKQVLNAYVVYFGSESVDKYFIFYFSEFLNDIRSDNP